MISTDWMDREGARIVDSERQADERSQRQLKASMSAQKKAPEFWKEFVDEVKVRTKELERYSTKSIDERIVGASTVKEPDQMFPDHRCKIAVTRHSVKFGPELCVLSFHYRHGATRIRRSPQGQRNAFIDIHAGPKNIVADVNGYLMTAKQLASYVVKGMYERVKFGE
jgi:hypothetical protein